MEWIAYGPRALLIRLEGQAAVDFMPVGRAIDRALSSSKHPLVGDYSIAFDNVLIELSDAAASPEDVAKDLLPWLEALEPVLAEQSPLHEIRVDYTGPDLAELAERHGLTVGEVVELHSRPTYEVAMIGFAPGFPYLEGMDPLLNTPRRASPRSRIPAGSVAIGGEHTGIYPVASPGGWNLIGHADTPLFDPGHPEGESKMFLLQMGDRVRFVPTPA